MTSFVNLQVIIVEGMIRMCIILWGECTIVVADKTVCGVFILNKNMSFQVRGPLREVSTATRFLWLLYDMVSPLSVVKH